MQKCNDWYYKLSEIRLGLPQITPLLYYNIYKVIFVKGIHRTQTQTKLYKSKSR